MFTLGKSFAIKLSVMIESHLISYKHYINFCDEIIDSMENPPYWIIELSVTKYIPKAVNIINEYAYSEPVEELPTGIKDFYIACLYQKYSNRQISWATFLQKAGKYVDGNESVKYDCEFFYGLLNDYEDSEFLETLEVEQHKKIKEMFKDSIIEVGDLYLKFQGYFREFIAQNVIS